MNTETLHFVIGSSLDWHYFIEVLMVFLGAATICLRWLESRRSEKRSIYQRWITICTLLMVLLSGVGLVLHRGEIRTNAAVNASNDARVKLEESKIVSLENNVSEGIQTAKAANREIANEKKLAADAKRRAEIALLENKKERVARLAAEDRSQPRRLIAEPGAEFVSCMRPFSGSSIEVDWVGSGGDETANLAGDFLARMTNAGIKISGSDLMMGVYFRGIKLRIGRDRWPQANVIARFLVEHGLSTKPVPAHFDEENPEELAILIGSKP